MRFLCDLWGATLPDAYYKVCDKMGINPTTGNYELNRNVKIMQEIDFQKKQLFLLDYDDQQIVELQNEIERRKSEYLRLRDEYNKQIS